MGHPLGDDLFFQFAQYKKQRYLSSGSVDFESAQGIVLYRNNNKLAKVVQVSSGKAQRFCAAQAEPVAQQKEKCRSEPFAEIGGPPHPS